MQAAIHQPPEAQREMQSPQIHLPDERHLLPQTTQFHFEKPAQSARTHYQRVQSQVYLSNKYQHNRQGPAYGGGETDRFSQSQHIQKKKSKKGGKRKNPEHESDTAKFIVHTQRIAEGSDARTVVMVRNIPNKYTQ